MSDINQTPPPPIAPGKSGESERCKPITTVGWVAGLSAFFLSVSLSNSPTWPTAIGAAAVAAMVAVVCIFILKRG